jgi:cell division protein FtsN
MAKKRRRTAAARNQGISPLAAMLFGLAVGLSVAFAVYVQDRRPAPVQQPAPASMQNALDDNGETAAAEPPARSTAADKDDDKQVQRFTFYDILPNFEMVTQDEVPTSKADSAPQAVVEPGLYVLQAGSFSTHEDADRRRAELALHGIESHIQRVKVNDRNYHRVYIGPTEDLDELNMLRSRLRAAQIDVLRIRLGD